MDVGPTCCHSRHDHGGCGGDHGGHCDRGGVGGGAGAGREHHCLFVGGRGQHGGGAQLGHGGGVVVRLRQDVGHKVGAWRRCDDDDLDEDDTFLNGVQRRVEVISAGEQVQLSPSGWWCWWSGWWAW